MNKQTLGTTILGIQSNNFIIIATDSFSTSGSYIINRNIDKISFLNNYIICCFSGSASDSQNILEVLKTFTIDCSNQTNEEFKVRTIAQILREICYKKKYQSNYNFICAGSDNFHGNQMYLINQSGFILKHNLLLIGSGSSHLKAFCDTHFNSEMSYSQVRKFAIRSISIAMNRDGNSGGTINIYSVCKGKSRKEIISPYFEPIVKIIFKNSNSFSLIV